MKCYWYTPCPCGNYGSADKACTCAPAVVTKYQKRISSPILDRIDIHIEVPRVDYENSAAIGWAKPASRFASESKPTDATLYQAKSEGDNCVVMAVYLQSDNSQPIKAEILHLQKLSNLLCYNVFSLLMGA
ncbi:MAG: ATP-binding protein [Anaerolineales bacterium]|nr:ATP-binding protein [Anaerolineales bacterium]